MRPITTFSRAPGEGRGQQQWTPWLFGFGVPQGKGTAMIQRRKQLTMTNSGEISMHAMYFSPL